jgi:hypothetical protein
VFGSCGFLSFSSVFCKFSCRFEASLYIHFIRRWVGARRRSSARREKKKQEKSEEGAPFFAVPSAGLGGVCGVYRQA